MKEGTGAKGDGKGEISFRVCLRWVKEQGSEAAIAKEGTRELFYGGKGVKFR